ncbi:MAG: RtcB family protein [Pseudomonadota bacterium]
MIESDRLLVAPTGDHSRNTWSLAHGAGRKWNRSAGKERLRSRCSADSLLRTDLGGWVICEDKDLLFEEAPLAYKNIDIVINDMVEAGLVSIIATFKPVLTYKTRRAL